MNRDTVELFNILNAVRDTIPKVAESLLAGRMGTEKERQYADLLLDTAIMLESHANDRESESN